MGKLFATVLALGTTKCSFVLQRRKVLLQRRVSSFCYKTENEREARKEIGQFEREIEEYS